MLYLSGITQVPAFAEVCEFWILTPHNPEVVGSNPAPAIERPVSKDAGFLHLRISPSRDGAGFPSNVTENSGPKLRESGLLRGSFVITTNEPCAYREIDAGLLVISMSKSILVVRGSRCCKQTGIRSHRKS